MVSSRRFFDVQLVTSGGSFFASLVRAAKGLWPGSVYPEFKELLQKYHEIRDHRSGYSSSIPKVDLRIEPIDEVTFQALVAKEQSILRLAERNFHIELPGQRMLNDARVRQAYADIFVELIDQFAADKSSPIVSAAMLGAAGQSHSYRSAIQS